MKEVGSEAQGGASGGPCRAGASPGSGRQGARPRHGRSEYWNVMMPPEGGPTPAGLSLRALCTLGLTAGVLAVCRAVEVSWPMPALLTCWGSVCFFFAGRFSGVHLAGPSRGRAVRGFVLWKLAGLVSWALAFYAVWRDF